VTCSFSWSCCSSHHVADPPILSSSPRNGSGIARHWDMRLVAQWDSSAYRARSLQNVPVRPPIAHSTPLFSCTLLRICHKIWISQRLRDRCHSDTDWNGRTSQEKEESWICTELAVGEPIERLRFVFSSCLQVLLTKGWPVLQEPYVQEPFLIDKDRIGGSAISLMKKLSYLDALMSPRFPSVSWNSSYYPPRPSIIGSPTKEVH